MAWLSGIPHVNKVTRNGGRVEVEGSGPILALTAAALVQQGIVPCDLHIEQPTLEDIFLKLTGHGVGE
jgi:ABC-2 type transport system ATP-binding protein